jgi:hypothetical protein
MLHALITVFGGPIVLIAIAIAVGCVIADVPIIH